MEDDILKHILHRENKNDRYKSEEQYMEFLFSIVTLIFISTAMKRICEPVHFLGSIIALTFSLQAVKWEKLKYLFSCFFSFWQLFRLRLRYSFIWIACHWCSFYHRLVVLHHEIIMRSGCESTYLSWRLFEWFKGIILMSCALQGWAYLTGVSHMKLQRTFSLPVNKRHPCS